MELKVRVTRGEAGPYVAQVRALKGCWSQGATRDEAVANAREAAALWLEVEQDNGLAGVARTETWDDTSVVSISEPSSKRGGPTGWQ
jgi:predicted RNase H-like HicB family nuclease